MSASREVLETFGANSIAQDVQEYLINTLKTTAVHRLATLLDKGQENKQAEDLVLSNIVSLKDKVIETRVAKADLLQAVLEAQSINELWLKRKASGMSVEEWEGPLPQYAQTTLQKAWDLRYHYVLLPQERMAPYQLGKLGREIERGALTMWQIVKVRTAMQSAHDRPTKTQDLAVGVQLRMGLDPDEAGMGESVDVHGYIEKLVVFCNGLGFIGVHARDATGERIADGQPGHDKPYVAWDTARHYAIGVKDRAFTVVNKSDGKYPPLDQIRIADEATRTEWMNRTSETQGAKQICLIEAIEQSFQHSMQHWKWASSDRETGSEAIMSSAPPGDNRVAGSTNLITPNTGTTSNGQMICKLYNDNRGCSEPCPGKNTHVCYILTGTGGQVCGSTQHNRQNCPKRKASKQFTRPQ